MPEIGEQGLDVSQEEERFLRRTFRRFALPYLVAAVAIAGLGVAGGLHLASGTGGSTTEIEGFVAEAAGLRQAIATLRQDLEAARGERVAGAERLDALERRVAEQRGVAASKASAEELRERLDHAHQRINALEGRLSVAESARSAPAAPEPAPLRPASNAWPPTEPTRP